MWPTLAGADCVSYCAINGGNTISVAPGTAFGPYRLNRYFSLFFHIYGPQLPVSGSANIFDILDVQGGRLLSMWINPDRSGIVIYNGAYVVAAGSFFNALYYTTWTGITISVKPEHIQLCSDATGCSQYAYTNAELYTRAYNVYVSTTGSASSLGIVSGMTITGKKCVPTSASTCFSMV
jgi:hypothetical protein